MQLVKAQIRDYRSVHDSGAFDIEAAKTILVGVNEAGKTALLRALQTVHAPPGTEPLEVLRDYPRSRYTEVQSGMRKASDVWVAKATFALDADDQALLRALSPLLASATHFVRYRYIDNSNKFWLTGVLPEVTFSQIGKDLARLRAHLTQQGAPQELVAALDAITGVTSDETLIQGQLVNDLDEWLEKALPHVDEDNEKEDQRFDKIRGLVRYEAAFLQSNKALEARLPAFVYYSTYFSVRPRIHLASFAMREAAGDLDLEYDFGNQCLLKLLGFTAAELSALAANAPPDQRPHNISEETHQAALEEHSKKLDDRRYRLNAASVSLTKAIREVWGDEQVTLRLDADGQYLKVVVVDDLGVEVELDQRSEGFRWLVSFFVVFKAQAGDTLKGAVLLLDEPGVSLHALKQQEFRKTVSVLGQDNQIIYTTHSPFMVGTDELDLVRIVEMKDRDSGTKVHTRLAVDDPKSLFPLQAALGYELAQSLFGQSRNLVCEGLTDMLYIESLSAAFRDAGLTALRDGVALVPAHSASKVIYYCTILTSQHLKVAALLDSDGAGEKAASQDELVRLLKPREILRTKDHYKGTVAGPEIEDLLRDTILRITKDDLGWDVVATATAQPTRGIVGILEQEVAGFSKYRLARAFMRWLPTQGADQLTPPERAAVQSLFGSANKALS